MKKFARMLSVVFFIVIFLGSVSGSQFVFSAAETSGKTGDCTWKLNGTVLTISGEGKIQDFPHVGNMYGGAPWGKDITSVIIKDGVTEIGNAAFYNCKNLTQVSMPDSLTRIGMVSFYGCEKLSVISIPDNIVRIEDGAFSNTAWLSNKPDGLVYAGKVAYIYKGNKKNITSVSIKDGTKYITGSAFFGCSGLKTISVPDSVESIGNNALNGTAWYDNKPNGIIYAGKVAYGYKGSMPSGKSIELREDTKGIAGYAFWNCTNLKNFYIPDNVKYIEDYAFFGCTSLEDIDIGLKVVFIGEKAFSKTSLRDIVIPAYTTHIGENALGYNSSGGMMPATAVDGFVIYGTKGTEAESYAKENGFTFKHDNRILWGKDVLDVSGNPTGLGWGRDNFAFTNSPKYFYDTYTISEEYMKALIVGLDDTVVRNICQHGVGKCGGMCYGMSSVVALMKTGFLTPSKYTAGAKVTHDLSVPKNSTEVMDIVTFYHLTQYLQDISDIKGTADDETRYLERLVTEAAKVKKDGMPLLTSFIWTEKKNDENYPYSSLDQKKKLLWGNGSEYDMWSNGTGIRISFSPEEINSLRENENHDDTIEAIITDDKKTYRISYMNNGNTIVLNNDEETLVLYRCTPSGHTVVAYDVRTFNENSSKNLAENGKHYKYRISICDPNKTQKSFLWVAEDYQDWYYHEMAVNANTGESNIPVNSYGKEDKMMYFVISEEKLINIRNPEKGIDNVSDIYKHNVDYFSADCYSTFNVKTGDKIYTVNSVDISEASELRKKHILGTTADGADSLFETFYYLPDSAPKNKPMKISTQKSSDRLDIDVMYENYSFEIESDYARNVDVDPQNASVSLSSKSGDFKLGATFNSGCTLSRPTVTVEGRDAVRTTLRFVSDGTIIEGDNLNNIIISSISPDDEVSMTFSTDKGAVKMMDIDNDTIGVFVDSDNNGTYETLLKTSDDITARILGDVDDDGKVEVTDATWIQRHIANAEMPFIPLKLTSDIDSDGEITSIDATMIQYYTVYKKTLYKIGESIA